MVLKSPLLIFYMLLHCDRTESFSDPPERIEHIPDTRSEHMYQRRVTVDSNHYNVNRSDSAEAGELPMPGFIIIQSRSSPAFIIYLPISRTEFPAILIADYESDAFLSKIPSRPSQGLLSVRFRFPRALPIPSTVSSVDLIRFFDCELQHYPSRQFVQILFVKRTCYTIVPMFV